MGIGLGNRFWWEVNLDSLFSPCGALPKPLKCHVMVKAGLNYVHMIVEYKGTKQKLCMHFNSKKKEKGRMRNQDISEQQGERK